MWHQPVTKQPGKMVVMVQLSRPEWQLNDAHSVLKKATKVSSLWKGTSPMRRKSCRTSSLSNAGSDTQNPNKGSEARADQLCEQALKRLSCSYKLWYHSLTAKMSIPAARGPLCLRTRCRICG